MGEEISTPTYHQRLSAMGVWATVEARRAMVLKFEWLALGTGIAALYVLFVLSRARTVTLLDAFVLVVTVGGGILMKRFEERRAETLFQVAGIVAQLEKEDA